VLIGTERKKERKKEREREREKKKKNINNSAVYVCLRPIVVHLVPKHEKNPA
jgi:hypothetical protein